MRDRHCDRRHQTSSKVKRPVASTHPAPRHYKMRGKPTKLVLADRQRIHSGAAGIADVQEDAALDHCADELRSSTVSELAEVRSIAPMP